MASSAQTSAVRTQKLDSSITLFSRPFTRSGVLPIGIRMTAVVLRNKDVALISPTPLDSETESGIAALGGQVKYIIAPNVVHHLSIEDWKKRYPSAKLIGVKGLVEKHPDVTFDGVIGVDDPKTARYGFEDEIEYRHFSGSANQDTAYYHKDTETMIAADLMFNLPPTQQYPPGFKFGFLATRIYPYLNPFTATHRFFTKHALSKDAKQTTEDVRFVAENWKVKRYVPSHGDVIEDGGDKAFRAAWAWCF
ncbi:hypothetical protein HKX48_005681 [Thoreauomyces humboldtii]|nr:hypothetical protein HKX48_005681 [Thoreauomyces humboldtii]